jgi:hypothetical protein
VGRGARRSPVLAPAADLGGDDVRTRAPGGDEGDAKEAARLYRSSWIDRPSRPCRPPSS